MLFESVSMFRVAIGLNDQKEKIQLVKTEDAYNLVSDYLANHFEGATVTMSKGVYKHENGVDVVKEESIVIDLVYVSDMEVSLMVKHFKKVFNQESVMVVRFPTVEVCFA